MRKLDESSFIGNKYGRWLVLDSLPRSSVVKVFCVCECGAKKAVNRDSLIRGLSTGCRKCSGMKGSDNPAYKGTKHIPGNFWGILNKSAKIRGIGIEFDINFLDDLLQKQEFKCAITGLPISLSEGKKGRKWTASVDRIDSSIGYTKSNVWFVHKDVNLMKNKFSMDRFIEICGLVTVSCASGKLER